ncbi:MAG: asparagine synthase, partial [Zoogloea sp.]|nr:asparagine synthase [Zoogloea sp.]
MAPAQRQPPSCLMASGRPRFLDPELAALARQRGSRVAWLKGWQRFGTSIAAHVAGDFTVAIRTEDGRTYLAIDRFAIRTLCYRILNGEILFSDRADTLAGRDAEIDPQALFDYLYFHAIPAPRTIFKGVSRIPPGHYVLFGRGRLTISPWWTPEFEEHSPERFPSLRLEFRQLLREAVQAQLGGERVGCFLSGGTDSSSVAGMLGEITGSSPHTFSIGFDADGYDEMAYARLAARHFGTIHHEYYLTPEDLVRSIPELAASYDQPFGNSSALPAYWCARLAAENGIDRLLAGDGGDELFGGNSRYARQRLLGLYEMIPGFVRRGLVEPALLGNLSDGSQGMRKLRSYVAQARVPMPARLQIDNLVARIGMAEVLTQDFLAAVDQEEPVRQQRRAYLACQAQAQINRMLAFDWKYTLADNDLPKVVGATTLAGVAVGFPLLDDRLVDFSLRL